MEIIFSDERMPGKAVVDKMVAAASLCVAEIGMDPDRAEVSVTFVDSEEIRELNRLHRGLDQVTDVLSFPQYARAEEMPRRGTVSIGDVVICSEQALLQAFDFGHSPERELVYLFVHRVFHLLGYGHESDMEQEEMREAEEKVMCEIGLSR